MSIVNTVLNWLPPKVVYFLWNLKLRLAHMVGGKVVGVRALVIRNDQVLLIYHTYVDGWCTIGGAVDKGETHLEALDRELKEEVGLALTSEPKLHGVFYNNMHKRDDYVIFYIVKDYEVVGEVFSREIAKQKWFPLNELPLDATAGTKRRIEEYLGKRVPNSYW